MHCGLCAPCVAQVGSGVYRFDGKHAGREVYRFTHRDTGAAREIFARSHVRVFDYLDVAEAITRAQKAAMRIELEHGRCAST